MQGWKRHNQLMIADSCARRSKATGLQISSLFLVKGFDRQGQRKRRVHMQWIQKEWLSNLSSESQCPTTPASLPHRRRQEQRRESVSMHMLLWCLMNHFAWGWGTGTHSSWGGVCPAEMYEGGAHHRWRQQPPCHLWLKQVRGESGMGNVILFPFCCILLTDTFR